jgi:hypothetical protein
MKKSEILRWVNREIAFAAERNLHVHASYIRVKKDNVVRFEREFVNAAGQGGAEFIDAVKKCFPKAKPVEDGECGDVFRGRAAHYVELKMTLPEGLEPMVSMEVRKRREVYAALTTLYRTALELRKEVKGGASLYSENVTKLLGAIPKAQEIKGMPQHHNPPAKRERKEQEKAGVKA